MKQITELKEIVKKILEDEEVARNSLSFLTLYTYQFINPNVCNMNYEVVMRNTMKLGLPTEESIARARRLIIKKFPELAGDEEVKRARKKKERVIRKLALEGRL